MAFQTSQAMWVCYSESKQRCPLKHIHINSVYFTHHDVLSQTCFSSQSLRLLQSHWDPEWTVDFSVKNIYGLLGPSKLLRSSENKFWALPFLFIKLEAQNPSDFGTVLNFASGVPLHCRKQGEEEPSGCFSFKWTLEDLTSLGGGCYFVFVFSGP